MKPTSFTYALTADQQDRLQALLQAGNYRPLRMPHTRAAAEGPACNIALYTSGKCLVQGAGAADWVTFVLEPEILQEVRLGYEEVLHPEASTPHMGVDESGKGDFFGPLVIAAAYVDPALAAAFRQLNVRDSKRITSDRVTEQLARDIRKLLGQRSSLIVIGPRAYNRLYAQLRNVNRILAWGHARAIENLLDVVPACPRALSDQFGPTRQIEQALLKKGRQIKLEQRPRAESDPAVAAASILARAGFLGALRELQEKWGCAIPKGASAQVQESARQLVARHGPLALLDTAKCHFKTADAVLAQLHLDRGALGPEGAAVSKPNPRGHHETGAIRTTG
ncbi:MAG: ribonuclease HIII [Kiritimatiellaeota bacterium]|nr:ribonuclease HIII [Kiritimatiellota bacterium]